MTLKEQCIFDKRYLLLKSIGHGGFSEIWLAYDEQTHIQIALKIYSGGSGLDDEGVKLFSDEFSIVFGMKNPYLLRPTGFNVFGHIPYLVMPYCSHGSIFKYLKKFKEDKLWKLMHDMASGLSYLHSQEPPIVHQDIKPENILLDDDGNFVITDFGISTKIRSTLRKSSMQISAGGTIAYMAPERFSKEPTPVKASDIWSMGATFYELMTGDVPFGEQGGSLQYAGAEIPTINSGYSTVLNSYVIACLSKDTWNRPTAQELLEAASKKIKGEHVSRYTKHKSWFWKKRKLLKIAAMIAVIVVVIGGGVGLVMSQVGKDTTNQPQAPVVPPPTVHTVATTPETPIEQPRQPNNVASTSTKEEDDTAEEDRIKEDKRTAEEEKRTAEEKKERDQFDNCATIDDYNNYLRRYPKGIYASTARIRIARLEKDAADKAASAEKREFDKCTSIDDYNQYLRRYPNGSYALTARQNISDMRQKQKENWLANYDMTSARSFGSYKIAKNKTSAGWGIIDEANMKEIVNCRYKGRPSTAGSLKGGYVGFSNGSGRWDVYNSSGRLVDSNLEDLYKYAK